MSEKRRPDLVFTIGKRLPSGKLRNMKVELFRCSQWPDLECRTPMGRVTRGRHDRFRLRVQGVWHRFQYGGEKTEWSLAVNKTEFRDLLWKSLVVTFASAGAKK